MFVVERGSEPAAGAIGNSDAPPPIPRHLFIRRHA
jgi:hypothetical protein